MGGRRDYGRVENKLMTPGVIVYPRKKLDTLAAWIADGGDVYHQSLQRQWVDSVYQDNTLMVRAASLGAIGYGEYYVSVTSSGVTIYIKNTDNPNYQNYFIYIIYARYLCNKDYDLSIDGIDRDVSAVIIDNGALTRSISRLGGTVELGMHTFSVAGKLAVVYAMELRGQRVEVVDFETMDILYRGSISDARYSAVSNILTISSEAGMAQRQLIEKPTFFGDCLLELDANGESPTLAEYAINGNNYNYMGSTVAALYDGEVKLTAGVNYNWAATPSYPYLISIDVYKSTYEFKGQMTARVSSDFKGFDFTTGLPTLVNSKNIADYLYYLFHDLAGEECNLASFSTLQGAGYETNMLVTVDTNIIDTINLLLASTLCYAVSDADMKIELQMHNRATGPDFYVPFESVTDWEQSQDNQDYVDIVIFRNDQVEGETRMTLGPGRVTKSIDISLSAGVSGATWSISQAIYTSGEKFVLSGVICAEVIRPGKKIWMEVDGSNYYMVAERCEINLNNLSQTIYCGKDYAPESGAVIGVGSGEVLSYDGAGMVSA